MKNCIFLLISLFLLFSCQNSEATISENEKTTFNENVVKDIDSSYSEKEIIADTVIFYELERIQKEVQEKLKNGEKEDEVIYSFLRSCDSLNYLIDYRDFVLPEFKGDKFLGWEIVNDINNYSVEFKKYFVLRSDEGEIWAEINPEFIEESLLNKSLEKSNFNFVEQYILEESLLTYEDGVMILSEKELFAKVKVWGELMGESKAKAYKEIVNSNYNFYMKIIMEYGFSVKIGKGADDIKFVEEFQPEYANFMEACISENPESHISMDFSNIITILKENEMKSSPKLEDYISNHFPEIYFHEFGDFFSDNDNMQEASMY